MIDLLRALKRVGAGLIGLLALVALGVFGFVFVALGFAGGFDDPRYVLASGALAAYFLAVVGLSIRYLFNPGKRVGWFLVISSLPISVLASIAGFGELWSNHYSRGLVDTYLHSGDPNESEAAGDRLISAESVIISPFAAREQLLVELQQSSQDETRIKAARLLGRMRESPPSVAEALHGLYLETLEDPQRGTLNQEVKSALLQLNPTLRAWDDDWLVFAVDPGYRAFWAARTEVFSGMMDSVERQVGELAGRHPHLADWKRRTRAERGGYPELFYQRNCGPRCRYPPRRLAENGCFFDLRIAYPDESFEAGSTGTLIENLRVASQQVLAVVETGEPRSPELEAEIEAIIRQAAAEAERDWRTRVLPRLMDEYGPK